MIPILASSSSAASAKARLPMKSDMEPLRR